MVRILRAFVWLRWRTLLNSLERRTSRDTLERFSIAVEQLAPTIAAVVMLPSLVALGGLAAYTGFSLAGGELPFVGWAVVRALLMGMCVLSVVGPILLPGGDRTNAVRLLLLPIPRTVLYLGHVISALADPWILLAAAIVIGLPLGFTAGGNLAAAAAAAGAGLLLIIVLVGVTLTVTSTVHLLLRDRRRGELLALIAVVVLPMLGIVPELLGRDRHRTTGHVSAPSERATSAIERGLVASIPSELYVHSMRPTPGTGLDLTFAPVAGLAAFGAAVHLLAFLTFVRILGSPGTTGPQRTVSAGARVRLRIPGASAATSAVALNQLRLAFRSPRGRATMVSPLAVFIMFSVLNLRGRDTSFLTSNGGLGMAAFSTFACLLALLPLAMNQFAIDRAGLTMAMLAPIETMTLLRGKALGNAAIGAIPGVICFAAAALLFPGGDPAVWICIPLSAIGAYILAAPIAAILSAVFPRPVDLNSIGRGSNAHGAAGLLGMLTLLVATAPGALITILVRSVFDRPNLAPFAVIAWIAVATLLSLLLFKLAGDVFDRRRENLGLTSQRS